ncbi:DUF4148 domain-containing protein [Candidimonas nitroreducens]|jgi:hypothetical protein|uniref:DUF4148 domain-containing protein n=1 Tax=Candidimonas nitroreducens TaxID=683354 RepID=A0A225N0H6_9BURK|nr:DUF4148 domain-containing protein [Candidimonas nitroreducens]OWT65560.1 hypothetical protein CEY11_02105 [Candidimonas nitroreducens]
MRNLKTSLSAALLLGAATMTARAQPLTPTVNAGAATSLNTADSSGKSKTRAEVLADLALWKKAGLDKFWSRRSRPNTFSREYKAAYAEYVRLRNGPEYKAEVRRQSGM